MPIRTHDGIRKRCGCRKRQWPKCPHPWHFSFHHRGTEHRYSLDVVARARHLPPPTSKAEAMRWRDNLRSEIRAGTFVGPDGAPPVHETAADTRLTFGDVCDQYLKAHVAKPTRRDAAQAAMRWAVGLIRATPIPAARGTTIRLEEKPIEDLTGADVEAFRDARRAILAQARDTIAAAAALEARAAATNDTDRSTLRAEALALRRRVTARPGAKGGEVGINRLLARLRHICTWAVKHRHIAVHPFKYGGETIVELETKAETARSRRLEPGEEERLLAHAGPHLRALIVAALTTGCRLGELLSLQWHQVQVDQDGQARRIALPASKTKTHEPRVIPVGTRLRAELDMRHTALRATRELNPDEVLPGTAYVFGNELGEPVARITTAWRATCRRAGITGLHFHDLRREFGSRLMESGAEQHDVRDWLGHANITTTSRYLKSTTLRLERALARMEGEIPAGFAHDSHIGPPVGHGPTAPDVRSALPKRLIQ